MDARKNRVFQRCALSHCSAKFGSVGHARPGRNSSQAVSINTAPLPVNIHALYWASVIRIGKFANSEADTAPSPKDTSKIGSAQQTRVVADVKRTSQAHFRGVAGSVTCVTLACGAWVIGMILWDVPHFLVAIFVPGNRTRRSLGKRAVGKSLVAKKLFQLGIGECLVAIGTDEYGARFEVASDRVDAFDLF